MLWGGEDGRLAYASHQAMYEDPRRFDSTPPIPSCLTNKNIHPSIHPSILDERGNNHERESTVNEWGGGKDYEGSTDDIYHYTMGIGYRWMDSNQVEFKLRLGLRVRVYVCTSARGILTNCSRYRYIQISYLSGWWCMMYVCTVCMSSQHVNIHDLLKRDVRWTMTCLQYSTVQYTGGGLSPYSMMT